MKISWKRKSPRVYYFESETLSAQAFIFSAPTFYLWAWAVWGHRTRAEGVEWDYLTARRKAEEAIRCLAT